MKRLTLGILALAGVCVLSLSPALAQKRLPGVTGGPATTAARPTPTPAPTPIDPSGGRKPIAATPPGPNVDGIAVGATTDVLATKCKTPGVTCTNGRRAFGGQTFMRTNIRFPASSPFVRIVVTSKDGTILSVKGKYRADDPKRVETSTAALGKGTSRRGTLAWAPANSAIVTEMDPRGQSIQYIDTKASTAKGHAVNPALFLATAVKPDSVRPAAVLDPGRKKNPRQNLPANTGPLTLDPGISASVTRPLKVPVKITLGELRCYDEQDPTSVFHGDDPYMWIVGTTTNPAFPRPWYVQRAYSDVEVGGHINVNTVVFPDDARRFLSLGDAVAVQITLVEDDFRAISYDDEIDFMYPIVDYTLAVANQNKTLEFKETLEGDGGRYTLAYKVEIGQGTDEPAVNNVPSRYRAADVGQYVGLFRGSLGDSVAEMSLAFYASKDPRYPNGVLHGTLKEGTTPMDARTTRLQGDSIEMSVRFPSGNAGWLVGYLVGEGQDRRIVGTLTRDGVTRGVALTKVVSAVTGGPGALGGLKK